MNQTQAQKEARKRWGKNGALRLRVAVPDWNEPAGDDGNVRQVGRVALGCMFMVEGIGATWADAFRDADRKARRDANVNTSGG